MIFIDWVKDGFIISTDLNGLLKLQQYIPATKAFKFNLPSLDQLTSSHAQFCARTVECVVNAHIMELRQFNDMHVAFASEAL